MTQPSHQAAADWNYEINERFRRSRTLAWIVAAVAGAISILCLVALLLLLPLKEFAPYVITVDRQTGYIEATRGVKPGDLTEDEAVTKSNIARFLIARETYDPADLKPRFSYVTISSEGEALHDYHALYKKGNPDSPVSKYGWDQKVEVMIKAISFLNKNTAQVRFLTRTKSKDQETKEHWVAILSFRYVQKPIQMAILLQNPLGFQVTGYRKDQENVAY